ncbi:MAG: DNA repair protein RecO [Lachnospiraceae bacterium]|nr:DNA repair protein RecO [Lachnospiraceae bacterium]
MNGQVTLTGMVINAMNVGEYDKRISILTAERGKISAFAKGARRQNNSLMAAVMPFSFGKFTFYEGRTSYNLVQAEISNYFMEIRQDIEKVSYGMYFLELSDYYTKENNDEKEVLKLLYQSLKALLSEAIPDTLVKSVFEIKIVALNGEISHMNECCICHSHEAIVGILPNDGVVVCNNCINQVNNVHKVSSSAIYTLQFIIYSKVEKLYTFTVTDMVLDEIKRFSKIYIHKVTGKKLKSEEMLEMFS